MGYSEGVVRDASDRVESMVNKVIDCLSQMEANLGMNADANALDSIRIDFQTLVCKWFAGHNAQDSSITTGLIEIYINNVNIDNTSPRYESWETIYQFSEVSGMLSDLNKDVSTFAKGLKKIYNVAKIVGKTRRKSSARIRTIAVSQASNDTLDTPRFMHTAFTVKGRGHICLHMYTIGGYNVTNAYNSITTELEGCLYLDTEFYTDDSVLLANNREITIRSVVIRERWLDSHTASDYKFNRAVEIALNASIMIESDAEGEKLIPFIVENGCVKDEVGARCIRIHLFQNNIDMLDYVTSLSIRQLASASRQIDRSMGGMMRGEGMVGYSITMHSNLGYLYPSNILKTLYVLMSVGEPRLSIIKSVQDLLLQGGRAYSITPQLTTLIVGCGTDKNNIERGCDRKLFQSIMRLLSTTQIICNMVTAPMRIEDVVKGDFTSEMLVTTLQNIDKVSTFRGTWTEIIDKRVKSMKRLLSQAELSKQSEKVQEYEISLDWLRSMIRFIQAMSSCDQQTIDRYMLSLVEDQERELLSQ
jgi:hypothetical protein